MELSLNTFIYSKSIYRGSTKDDNKSFRSYNKVYKVCPGRWEGKRYINTYFKTFKS